MSIERRKVGAGPWLTVVAEAGGGGDLPDWWTVDSTPGSESVEFGGEVRIAPGNLDTRGLDVVMPDGSIQPYFGFYEDAGNFGIQFDSGGGLRQWAPTTGDLTFQVSPTGAVTISPTDPDAIPLQVSSADLKNGSYQYAEFGSDGEWTAQLNLNGLDLKGLTGEGRSSISMSSRDSLETLELNSGGGGANQPFVRAYDGSAEVFVVADEGAVTISPSDDAALPLQITLPSNAADELPALVISAQDGDPLYIDGGGSFDLRLLVANAKFQVRDDDSVPIVEVRGSTQLGFYGATPVAKPTGVAVDAAGIHAALVSLGLIAA